MFTEKKICPWSDDGAQRMVLCEMKAGLKLDGLIDIVDFFMERRKTFFARNSPRGGIVLTSADTHPMQEVLLFVFSCATFTSSTVIMCPEIKMNLSLNETERTKV